jgi:hypothetical protein
MKKIDFEEMIFEHEKEHQAIDLTFHSVIYLLEKFAWNFSSLIV